PEPKVYKLATFQLELPKDWKTQAPGKGSSANYVWRGSTKDNVARSLEVYVDRPQASLAVNRMLPVKANGNKVEALSTVSDNCANFTDSKTTNVQTGVAPSKWSAINFWCDMANYQRNVTGTSSPEGINTVT